MDSSSKKKWKKTFHSLSVASAGDRLESAIIVRRSAFLAMQRQDFRQVSMQKVDEGLTQDGWLDVAAGEIERTATFKEYPVSVMYRNGISWLAYCHASGCGR